MDRVAARELVATEVVRWVHVRDDQDARDTLQRFVM